MGRGNEHRAERDHRPPALRPQGGGRQAAAAAAAARRELFDTLLLWKAQVVPDANGEAVIEVPLNDSLTSFKLVAVADEGVQRFGTGSASIRVTQDLQVLSGLPPLVRDGDQFSAMLTLRNTTAREMKMRVTLAGTASGSAAAAAAPIALPPQDVVIAAGGAKEVAWPVSVPAEVVGIALGSGGRGNRQCQRVRRGQGPDEGEAARFERGARSRPAGDALATRRHVHRARRPRPPTRCRRPAPSAAVSTSACSPG